MTRLQKLLRIRGRLITVLILSPKEWWTEDLIIDTREVINYVTNWLRKRLPTNKWEDVLQKDKLRASAVCGMIKNTHLVLPKDLPDKLDHICNLIEELESLKC